eukprot:263235_1
MTDKQFHPKFPLTKSIVESVCNPKEYGNKIKYPFINYLPFTAPSNAYINFAIQRPLISSPNPRTINQFRKNMEAMNLEAIGAIKDKSKCTLEELFIPDKITNNIIHAYCMKHKHASIKNGVIIECHGGGYILFNSSIRFHFAEIISKLTKCVVILLDYKLAPEFPLPIAVNELIFLYKYILTEYNGGIPYSKIAMTGDSAGGGLVMLGLQSMKYGRHKKLKLPQPCCVWLNSPWVNLSDDAQDKYKDSVLYAQEVTIFIELMSNWAVGNNDNDYNVIGYKNKRSEIYSPQYGRFDGLSPMYFMVGACEIFALYNTVICAEKAYKCGVEVQFDIAPYMPHVWACHVDMYPEAMDACIKGSQWILQHLNGGRIIQSKL